MRLCLISLSRGHPVLRVSSTPLILNGFSLFHHRVLGSQKCGSTLTLTPHSPHSYMCPVHLFFFFSPKPSVRLIQHRGPGQLPTSTRVAIGQQLPLSCSKGSKGPPLPSGPSLSVLAYPTRPTEYPLSAALLPSVSFLTIPCWSPGQL